MAQFIVAKSIAFAFPDSSLAWDLESSTFKGARVTDDGVEITQSGGVFELTLELQHTTTVDAFVSIDGTILKEADHVSAECGGRGGDTVTIVRHLTKIRDGSVISVWAKNNVQGVFRGAVLTIRKMSDDISTR